MTPALGPGSADPQTWGRGPGICPGGKASSGGGLGRWGAGSLRTLGHSRFSPILTRLTLNSPKPRCCFLGWEGAQRWVPMPSSPGLGPLELFLLPTGTPVGFVAQSSVEAAAWGGPGPSAHAPPSPQAQASAPCLPTSLSAHRGRAVEGGVGELSGHLGVWGGPDPQRSFQGPTGLSDSQVHQESCGVQGGKLHVSPGWGAGLGGGTPQVQGGGRCVLGEGLFGIGSSPVLHPESVHTSGRCAQTWG